MMVQLLLAASAFLPPALSAEPPANTDVRQAVPLDGKWFARFTNEGADKYRAVQLPLDAEGIRTWNRPAVFKTEFQYEEGKGLVPRFIRLSRVQGFATVHVNDKEVGKYRGFYRLAYAAEFGRPRSLLIPDGLLKAGRNELSIRLDEDRLWKPGYRLGGIQGTPQLLLTGQTYLSEIGFATEKPGPEAEYRFTPRAVGPRPRKVGLLVEKFTGAGPYSGPTVTVNYEESEVPDGGVPTISWRSHPHFATYRATVILLDGAGRTLDSGTHRFHTVYAEVKGLDFLLNNEKFIAKGAVSLGPQLIGEVGLTYCNWFNFNLIRLDFMGRKHLDSMWRHGILAMELVCFSVTELPRVWNPKFPEDTLGKVRPIVQEYAEHPSIIFWNSANEVSNADTDFLGALYGVYKEHDPYQRPVTYAGIPTQELPDDQDVMGVNYGNTYEALKTYVEHAKGKPVFSTEWRVSATPQRLRQYWGWLKDLRFAGGAEYGTVAMIGRTGTPDWGVATQGHKWMYRDLDVVGFAEKDGTYTLEIKNVAKSPVRNLTIYKATTTDRYAVKEIGSGDQVTLELGKSVPSDHWRRSTFFLKYTTHHGLPHDTFEDLVFRKRK